MATSMTQPGGPQQPNPQQGQGQGGPAGQQSASPQLPQVQEFFGKQAIQARDVGNNMVIVQPEMQQISALWVKALQKVSQAASGPPQQAQSPGVQ